MQLLQDRKDNAVLVDREPSNNEPFTPEDKGL